MTAFTSILVANRGEIACRVIRSAQALGYHTVAVYSEVDASAPHALLADEAVCIGPGPVGQSYLLADKIIAAAKQTGAQAIHPGYGFLSENADFARQCSAAGLVFIGPSAEAITVMGNKAESKRCMLKARVRCVPGYEGADQADAVLIKEAKKIGLPVMVKAAAGGGGRGMRLVHKPAELPNAIKLARSEAENAFGSGELILEKAIMRPRHVELQVFADSQGNTVHLGERDCSVQRRHQKVVEEAPCPVMTEALRNEMGAQAVSAAKAINYLGAGTVEFLLDENGEFYFLEMNTRLQVEHPVTEMITGLDLVALQIQVAQGEPLGFDQQDVSLNGHAIEVRLYTEDPAQDFLPVAGRIDLWAPAAGPGIRVDDGVKSGQELSAFYDPMVAKIIAHGPSREAARLGLIEALKNTALFGVKNNKTFLLDCLQKPTFIDGAATTAFIADEFSQNDLQEEAPDITSMAIAAVLDHCAALEQALSRSVSVARALRNWSSASPLVTRKIYRFNGNEYALGVSPLASGITSNAYLVQCAQQQVEIDIVASEAGAASMLVDGERQAVLYHSLDIGQLYVSVDGRAHLFVDWALQNGAEDEAAGGGRVLAPMHGLVLEVFAKVGEQVKKGQPLLVLEAMKMQHEIVAQADGKISEVSARASQQVAADDLLVAISIDETAG
ncbi:MAG: acetyl-CoA carboxylase biotin carboxylase subunit [Gammaproteobacteria bacterium]|nr:acetyl-CoA carboxylase biotin carboxylase subunit [Gammaproteobacteria bacterium]